MFLFVSISSEAYYLIDKVFDICMTCMLFFRSNYFISILKVRTIPVSHQALQEVFQEFLAEDAVEFACPTLHLSTVFVTGHIFPILYSFHPLAFRFL